MSPERTGEANLRNVSRRGNGVLFERSRILLKPSRTDHSVALRELSDFRPDILDDPRNVQHCAWAELAKTLLLIPWRY